VDDAFSIGVSMICVCFLHVHPWKLTWNLKMKGLKMIFLSKVLIFRFHVNFWGSMISFEPMWKTFCFRADDISDIATGPWGRFDRTQRLWEKYSVADAYEASFPWWWSDPWPTLSRWILSTSVRRSLRYERFTGCFCWVSQLHMFYIPL